MIMCSGIKRRMFTGISTRTIHVDIAEYDAKCLWNDVFDEY